MSLISDEIKAEGHTDGHIAARWALARELLLTQSFSLEEVANFVGLTSEELRQWKVQLLTENQL